MSHCHIQNLLSCFRQSWLSIGSNQSLFERCSRFVFGTGTRSSFDPKNSGFAKMYSRLVCPSPVPQNAGSCYRWVSLVSCLFTFSQKNQFHENFREKWLHGKFFFSVIQKNFRAYNGKRKYQMMKNGYLRLQAVIRSRILSHRFRHLRGHIIRLQARSRGFLIR